MPTNYLISQLIEYKMIQTIKDNPSGWTLKSGLQSDIYVNLRNLGKYPHLFHQIIEQLISLITTKHGIGKGNISLIGIPTWGTPLAAALSYRILLPLGVLRQKIKNHGMAEAVEGAVREKIFLIDDVITTGASMKESEDIIKNNYYKVKEINYITVVDRELHNYNVESLLSITQIKDYLSAQ